MKKERVGFELTIFNYQSDAFLAKPLTIQRNVLLSYFSSLKTVNILTYHFGIEMLKFQKQFGTMINFH